MRRLLIITVFVIHNMYGIAQNGFTKPFWDAYNNAADPVSKREAYQKLEGIYSRYRADTALLISNDYLQYAEKTIKTIHPISGSGSGLFIHVNWNLKKQNSTYCPCLKRAKGTKTTPLKRRLFIPSAI